MVHGPAANAIWLQYLCPVWVLLASVFLFKEKIVGSDWRMFFFCLAGVMLILCCEMLRGRTLYATFLGLLSGVGLAGVLISMRWLRDADPAWLITLNHSGSVLLMAPWAWWEHRPVELNTYLALAFFGMFQMSVPYLLFARGLRSVTSPEGSVLALIEPILVPCWVYVAWRNHPSYESPPWWTFVGATLICVGLLSRYAPAMVRAVRTRRGDASDGA